MNDERERELIMRTERCLAEIGRLRAQCEHRYKDLTECAEQRLEARAEVERLRAENATMNVDIDVLHRLIDTLRNKNDRLSAEGQRVLDKMNAYKADCETLRELVREALDKVVVSFSWSERAEKALTQQT